MPQASQEGRSRFADLLDLVRLMFATDGWRFLLVVLLGLALALTDGAVLILLLPIVQGLSSGIVNTQTWPIVGNMFTEVPLWTFVALLLTVVVIRGLVGLWRDRTTARLRLEVLDRERMAAIEGMLQARWNWVASHRTSDIMQTVNTEVSRVGATVGLFSQLVVSFLETSVVLIIAFIWLPLSGLVALLLLVAALAMLIPFLRMSHELGRQQVMANRLYARTVSDVLSSLAVIRISGTEKQRLDTVSSAMGKVADIQVRYATRAATHRGIITTLSIVMCLAVLAIATRMGVSLGELVVLAVLLVRLLSSAQNLSSTISQLTVNLPAVSEVSSLRRDSHLHQDPLHVAQPSALKILAKGPLQIECENISFSYGDTLVLHNFNIQIPKSEITAITGTSGSGKSTLLDLVMGLLAPDEGVIHVQGCIAHAGTFGELRSRTGYVPQNQRHLYGSLRENITWVTNREVTDQECLEALSLAQANFVVDLPDGLDTIMGEHGYRLSGGEGQRLAIAGALLRKPDLLVLDEATNSLDADTEGRLLTAIRGTGTTLVIVSHRQATLDQADWVVNL